MTHITNQDLIEYRAEQPKTLALITEKQYKQLIKMFKGGAIFDEALAYLELTQAEAFSKRNVYSGDYDEKFVKAIALGEVHSSVYWFKQRKEENPRVWMYIMKNQFGWSGGVNHRKHSAVEQVNYDPDKPAETMDRIISAVARNEISAEKAKVLTETIINSYNCRQVQ